jgi:hypothetical protein
LYLLARHPHLADALALISPAPEGEAPSYGDLDSLVAARNAR